MSHCSKTKTSEIFAAEIDKSKMEEIELWKFGQVFKAQVKGKERALKLID